MASPVWQASTQYPAGSIVQRASSPSPVAVAIPNDGFESGAVNWNFGGNIVLSSTFRYQGTNSLRVNGTGTLYPQINTAVAVTAGTSVTASCMYHQGAASAGVNKGRVCLIWYTAGLVEISKSFASTYITSSDGGWKKSTVTAIAPATAAFVKIAGESVKGASAEHHFDNFVWNLTAPVPTSGLEFKAVQSGTGTSAGTEPTWPSVLGNTVVDGSVTWQAVTLSSVTWTADPDLVSGVTEPTWATGVGNYTVDGNRLQWEAISRTIDDPKCPQKTVVSIGASKVFVGDDDIMRFSATVNPLDWTSERDAGYLPTGLQQAGANNITVSGLYRNNLVVFNANCFQMWQIDPDPESMALLDQMQGIGSVYQQAAQEVADELFFLSAQGVRTIGLSASSESLQSGDVGSPIDSLVVPSVVSAEQAGLVPRATYYTGAGQYWLTGDTDNYSVASPSRVVAIGGSGLCRYKDAPVSSGSWVNPQTLGGFTNQCITFGNGIFVVGSYQSVYTSPDGVTWTNRTVSAFTGSDVVSIAFGNGVFVIMGALCDLIATSTDGITWTARTSALSSANTGAVTFGGGCFIATASPSRAMRSTDGISWSLVTLGLSATGMNIPYCVAWTGTTFVVATNNSQQAVQSTDGITWSALTIGTRGTNGTYYGWAWGEGKGLILCDVDGYYRFGTSNLTVWTQYQVPSCSGLGSACYDGTNFVFGSSGIASCRTSPDGITWTNITTNLSLSGGNIYALYAKENETIYSNQNVFVYTQNQVGKMGSWSRYQFPFSIDGFATLGNKMYMRGNNGTNDCVYEMDESLIEDDGIPFEGLVQYPWLDFGTAGVTKMMETVDIVGNGVAPTISIGYDQTNPLAVTTPYQLQADSMTGFPVPIPVSAPTFSIKLAYPSGGWELQQFNVEIRQNWKIR